jgi:competence ComEA-like helix-hairpin-helix protein
MRMGLCRLARLCALGMLVAAGLTQVGRAQVDLPEGNGREIVQNICSQCHGLREVVQSRMDAKAWENTVYDMIGRGAPLMEDEIPVVIEYLTKSFPREQADSKINVNKATVKQLEETLKLTAKEAEALVQHRQENGYFHNWEELTKVQGLDAKKIEAAKDRLAF